MIREKKMFGKKKPDEINTEALQVETVPQKPAAPKYAPSKKTVIADGVTMVGDFVTSDPMEINGTVKGNVVSEKNLYVSRTGRLRGDARVSELLVDGNVQGAIVVEGLSTISGSGIMRGSLQTARFASEPGSVFDGTFSMSIAKKVQNNEENKNETF